MDRFWVISDSKKGVFFFLKSPFLFFVIKQFLHTFCQKRTFCHPTTFIESLITHKRFIFEESYFSYGKGQKELYFNCCLVGQMFLSDISDGKVEPYFLSVGEVLLYSVFADIG